jgi:hypothetical protein
MIKNNNDIITDLYTELYLVVEYYFAAEDCLDSKVLCELRDDLYSDLYDVLDILDHEISTE